MIRFLLTWFLRAARQVQVFAVTPAYKVTASFMDWCARAGAGRTLLGLVCIPPAFVVYALVLLWNVAVLFAVKVARNSGVRVEN
jgi:hypothetical protein